MSHGPARKTFTQLCRAYKVDRATLVTTYDVWSRTYSSETKKLKFPTKPAAMCAALSNLGVTVGIADAKIWVAAYNKEN